MLKPEKIVYLTKNQYNDLVELRSRTNAERLLGETEAATLDPSKLRLYTLCTIVGLAFLGLLMIFSPWM